MKKRNKFKIRGNLKKKLAIVLCGVSALLGVYVAKETKENLDAEIALAAAQPVARQVAYVEDSESTVLENENNQNEDSEKADSVEDNGILLNNLRVSLVFGAWATIGFLICIPFTIANSIELRKEFRMCCRMRHAKKEPAELELEDMIKRDVLKEFKKKDDSKSNDIAIKEDSEITPDSNFINL